MGTATTVFPTVELEDQIPIYRERLGPANSHNAYGRATIDSMFAELTDASAAAVAAAVSSEAAKDLAELAKIDAELAQTASETAQTNAEAAEVGAVAAWAAAALDAAIVRSAITPADPWDGMLWWFIDTADDILRIYDASSTTWTDVLVKNRTTGALTLAFGTATPTAGLIALYNADNGLKSGKAAVQTDDVLRLADFAAPPEAVDNAADFIAALLATPAEVNARCAGYPNLGSAKNTIQVTVTSFFTTILVLDIGSWNIGDIIRVEGFVGFEKGATAGMNTVFIGKDSGTAVINSFHDATTVYSSVYIPASTAGYLNPVATFRVTTGGTLVLRLIGASGGSSSLVDVGWGQLAAYPEKKQ